MTSSISNNWYRDNFLLSTNASLLQIPEMNKAFNSDDIYWCSSISEDSMKKLISRSLCFGLYQLPESSSEIAGKISPAQIGLARLITDEVTFAYLTDVYILKEYRGRGLGVWMMECVNETTNSWPDLRGLMLYSNEEHGQTFYKKVLNVDPYQQGRGGHVILSKRGPGSLMSQLD